MNLKDSKRIVVKIGTSTLTHSTGRINIRRMENLVKVLSDLKNSGKEILLVTSGAIGVGVGKLKLDGRPSDMPSKQACAAIGQCELMYMYDGYFSEYEHIVAQVLLTRDVIANDGLKQNVVNTLNRLLEYDTIPIINENDTVSCEEIDMGGTFGENDTLSAIVSVLVEADLLIILTDIDGLYDKDPRLNNDAKLLPLVNKIDDELLACAGCAGSDLGTGGMQTKLHAAKIALDAGVETIIINGDRPENLYDLFDGKEIGTHFTIDTV